MNKKNIRRIIFFLILSGIVVFRFITTEKSTIQTDKVVSILEELQSKKLVFTHHAECRMDCRFISEEEIRETLKAGKINPFKSYPDDQPCPSYAIEDTTADGQVVRIIFANCKEVVKVVTAIDLNNELPCSCK